MGHGVSRPKDPAVRGPLPAPAKFPGASPQAAWWFQRSSRVLPPVGIDVTRTDS